MSTNKDKNAHVTRWFLELQNFRFRVEHRAGRFLGNVDALSRKDECLWSGTVWHGPALPNMAGSWGKGYVASQFPIGIPLGCWATISTHGERPQRRRHPLGQVVESRYYDIGELGRFRTQDSSTLQVEKLGFFHSLNLMQSTWRQPLQQLKKRGPNNI